MSEIDRKLGLSIFSSFSEQDNFLSTTPGSVAAAISSALETAAEDNTVLSEQSNSNYYQLQYNQNSYTNNSSSSDLNSFKNFSDSVVKEGLVSSPSPQHHHHHTPLLLPVAPLRPDSFVDVGCGGGSDNNDQLLLTSGSSNCGNTTNHHRGRGSRTSNISIDSAAGNHVDDQFRSSSACSQFLHQPTTLSSSFSSSSLQMADKQDYGSSGSFNQHKTSVRDKSDNRETYPVSHCKEKSATDNREVDSGGGGGGSSRVFKPSSKIIDLPEKSTSSSTSHDHHHSSHHHHHHHSRNKDSRIPVGIAVAWQRLVTTSSTNPGVTSTMTTKADCGNQNKSKMSSNNTSSLSSTMKHPSRPSSASSLKSAAGKMMNNNSYSASNPNLSGFGGTGDNNSDILSSSNSNRPMSACGDAITGGGGGGGTHVPYCPSPASPALSRPLPSSSVPPNLGYPTGYSSQYPPHHPYHHHRNAVSPYLEYSYAAAAAAQRPFVVPSPVSPSHHHSHPSLLASNGHPYWGLDNPPPPPVPLLSPGISPSPNVAPTDYLQQLSLQQQQMHLHSPHHHLHQQHLIATANRQLSSPSPSTTSSSSPYNPYLPFLYPQDAAASLAAAATAAATMNKNPYYDHYFHQQQQQQQMLLQNQGYLQQQPHPISIPTPPVSGNSGVNSAVSNNNASKNSGSGDNSSASGSSSRFDLLANNNNNNNINNNNSGNTSSGSTTSTTNNTSITNNTHRAIPMQVASPISRANISLLSCSPTGAGGIRTPTPTASSTSSSPSSSSTAEVAASATTTTAAAVTSSAGSAFSTFSTSTTSQQNPAGSGSHSLAAGAPSSPVSTQELNSMSTPTTTTITASSPSPSLFLLHHQQQHPHLFSSSTAALSPKSLTSSTPSPVTVHDFNSGLNVVISSSAAAASSSNNSTTNTSMAAATRKCATPSPISLTPTRALLSPFPPGSPYGSPSPIPSNNNNNNGNYKDLLVWKEDVTSLGTKIKPIPINGHTRETHSCGGGSLTTPPPLSSPLLSLAHHNNMRNNNCSNNKITSVSTPMSSPSSYTAGQKHDFKRLESLIERRDSESISPLVLIPQHSPATSTTSSILDSSDEQKLATIAAEEKVVNKTDNAGESQHDDDDDDDEPFCISVKLENPMAEGEAVVEKADEWQQRSNNELDDSFKVKPPTTKIRHDVVVSALGDKQEEMKICMMKSDPAAASPSSEQANRDQEDGESQEGVKVKVFSDAINNAESPTITIISCDANHTTVSTDPSTGESNIFGERISENGDGEGDPRKNQHGGLHPTTLEKADKEGDDASNENFDKVVEGNDVPEPTLLSRSSNNFNETSNNKNTDDYFRRNNSFTKDNHNHAVNIKDVSFTSGYSSSHEDNNNEQQKHSLLVLSPLSTPPPAPVNKPAPSKKPKKSTKKEVKPELLKPPSLKIKTNNKKKENKIKDKKVKGKLLSMSNAEGEQPKEKKRNKKMKDTNDGSFKASAAATLLSSKPTKSGRKKTSSVCTEQLPEKMKKSTKKGAAALKKVASMSLSSSSSSSTPASLLSSSGFPNDSESQGVVDKMKKEKKAKRSKSLVNDGKINVGIKKAGDVDVVEKVKNKKCLKIDTAERKSIDKGGKRNKSKSSTVVATEMTKKSREGSRKSKTKNAKTGSQGISQQQGWASPNVQSSPAVTNTNYQQFVKTNNKSDTSSSSYFISPNMTSVSGDIMHSGNNNLKSPSFTMNSPQDLTNSSLTSNNPHHHHHQQQQQPMAVILHQSSPALQSPSQVTFLITSPTSDRTGGTSPLRIPAYIPRSGATAATAVVASADELVGGNGESYSGPATLTLHRDMDAVTSPQQTFYQPPPAITIQYHHSAPATPMTMEAASPSSLDLLATVAQEFGSREDLGKRLSIDGGSSCNASSIGESPPMSPQKSPGAYHQHYTPHYPSVPTVPTLSHQKHVSNPCEIMSASGVVTSSSVPPPPPPISLSSPAGKRPKSPKKQPVKTGKAKADHKGTSKTSNSITLKQSSKKAMMMKVGKKEKRTVSDSAFYTSPVVLLKIPQVPGLCSKKTLQQQQQKQQQDKAKKTKEKNSKVKADDWTSTVGAISKSKPKPINNKKADNSKKVKEDDKLVVLSKQSTKGIQSKKDDKNDDIKRKEEKRKNKKAAALSSSSSSVSPSKSLLLLSLPTSTTVTTTTSKNSESTEVKKKVKKEKKAKSEEKRASLSSSSSSSLLSPLSILPQTTTTTSTSSTDQIITTTPSPTKDRSSSFYNPPERISAFAKQVISRRSSAAGVSPTKLQINNSAATTSPFKVQQQGSPSVFFPIQPQKQQQTLPNSPTIKMPQLIPFDVPLEPSTPTSPSPKQHSFPVPPSSLSPVANHNDSSSSSVPKTVNFKRFPSCSKISPSHLPPPLLVPSVSSSSSGHDKKDYCDVNDDARYLSSSEQDKEKTDDNIVITIGNRSPSSCSSKNKASSKERKRKDSESRGRMEKKRKKEKGGDEYKKAKKKRRSSEVSDDVGDVRKKEKTKKKKKSIQSSLASGKVPKITITQQSCSSAVGSYVPSTPNASIAFSPLTPPLTAKSSMEGEDGDEGTKSGPHHHRQSAFACLQVPGGSSTPCSSLASRRSSPSVNAEEEEGETETTTENENENDANNVWVADPMFAVSAIKLTNISSAGSNQPTDAEESAADEDIDSDGKVTKEKAGTRRKDNMPLKLSLFNVKQQQETSATTPLSPVQKEQQNRDRERFLEVKSQLKAFVHFKPQQLTGNKKGHHSIKPCLKAEPVVRARSIEEDEEEEEEEDVTVDDDEDFHLDMEVANITTQNAPTRKAVATTKKGVGSIIPATATSCASTTSSTTASTGSNKKRKPSINRNSSSYITNNTSSSTSQSKKHHSLSTKEIMSKVFSRKVSPELSEKTLGVERKSKKRRSSGCLAPGTDMDADDEDDDEDELLDIDDVPPLPLGKSHSSHNHHHQSHHPSHSTQISMSAAAAAVVVNSNNVAPSAPSTSSLSTSSLALLSSLSSMKKPKKRSARSSTTSSCASTKSNSRGNKGQSVGGSVSISAGVVGGSGAAMAPNTRASAASSCTSSITKEKDEIQVPGKVELDSVQELVDEMRILTDIQGLFYTGRLNALQPPDVYGVTLDNERGAPPHLIFSAEEVLEKCLREKKPQPEGLCSGMRICAYWSPQYSGLYPGRVSSDFSPKFDPDKDLIPIEFDDGDTGMIKLKEIRLLSVNHPVREYDPNPLLTLEKKHRKRRHSSATGTSGGCTGDHEEPDCGEPYCAKIGKLEEDDEEDGEDDDDHNDGGAHLHHSSSKMLYWTWSGLGYKRPKSKKNRNKEFFHGIQRGNEVINVGDAALFISTGNERPFIGRVERFWERKGKKMVNVRWFYHPEEVKASAKRLSNLKYPGALFESPHIDENDVQTIAKKCDVLPFAEFKKRLSGSSAGSLRVAKLSVKSTSKPRDMYYVAGFYDPYTYNLTLKDLK